MDVRAHDADVDDGFVHRREELAQRVGHEELAGNIYPPSSVVVDPEFIKSLDTEDVAAGLGEAVKIAFSAGPEVFAAYLRHFEDRSHWEPLIEGVLTAKKWFVETDEFDRAERRLLNFGHTFGHALETATDYRVNHGVAVIVGMLAAAALRRELYGTDGCDEPLREHCGVILGKCRRSARGSNARTWRDS